MALELIPMLGFLRPERLWWLVLLPLLLLLYAGLLAWRRNRGRRHPTSKLERVIPQQQAWKRHTAVILAVLSLGTLTLAFAQPKDEVDVPRERATIVITIDVSRSMMAEDVPPNRMDAAKQAAQEFLGMLPDGFNVALVRFAATAAVVVPPTSDRSLVKAAIERLQVAPSTATGEGIYSSLDAMAQAPPDPDHPGEPAPGAIVLLSDGARNAGRPDRPAAVEAKEKGIPIFTIAYGTPNGYVMEGDKPAPVPVNHSELRDIARLSGGEKFEAESLDELRKVYESIAQQVGYVKADQEVTEAYAGYALFLA
ncbi:MAG: VWA domain-containing protein, partial [Propionibacteriaceae bacterium]|nr:VWA domain-containing protein [Propionibacteriaceae bacterium]